ncbi:MAG: hypothetical protein ACOYOK_03655 [Pseudobdellovibrionaceae bacterium]
MKFLSILSFILCSNLALAIDTNKPARPSLADLAKQQQEVEAQLKDLAPKLKTAEEKYRAIEEKVSTQEKAVEAANSQYKKDAGLLGSTFGIGDSLSKKSQNDLEQQKQELKKLKIELKSERTNFNKLDKDSRALQNSALSLKNNTEKANEALNTSLNGSNLVGDFERVKSDVGDLDQTLDILITKMDQATIGSYVKDKLGLLLNSQLICKAVKRCSVAEPQRIPNEEVEKALFPGTASSTRKQDYYNKINNKNSAQ